MVQAISEMSTAEKYMTDDDPDLLEAVGLTEEIRGKELLRAYKLRKKVEGKTPEASLEILEKWALGTGRSVGAWKADLKWAFAIDPDDLLSVFAEAGVLQGEWTQRIGTSHLGVVARAKHQQNHLLLTSWERAEWVLRAYDNNLSVDQLGDMLRDHDLLPPKKNMKTKPIEQGKLTGCTLLELTAEALRASGKDFDLGLTRVAWDKPIKAYRALRRLSELVEQLAADVTIQPEEGT